uniref:Claudin n=1 Tax=Salvator merianae TaxID=96440 RepID=A0A8D0DJ53_SALMN
MATGMMVLGLVVAPMGWILILAATVTPQWREFPKRPGFPQDIFFSDGLWESCMEVTSVQDMICQTIPGEMAIFWPLQMVRVLTIISVLTGFLSYVLAHVGARWWSGHPNCCVTGGSGLLLLLSGVLYLCATSYMAYDILDKMASSQASEMDKYHLGTCLYLGWSGGVVEVFAGMCLATGFQTKNGNGLRTPCVPCLGFFSRHLEAILLKRIHTEKCNHNPQHYTWFLPQDAEIQYNPCSQNVQAIFLQLS